MRPKHVNAFAEKSVDLGSGLDMGEGCVGKREDVGEMGESK